MTAERVLDDFEGHTVTEAAIEIPNVAGGFQESMKLAPHQWEHDDHIVLVIRARVRKVRFDEIVDKNEPTGELRRVHVLHALSGAIVADDDKRVSPILNSATLDLKRLRDERAGQMVIPGADDDDEEGDG